MNILIRKYRNTIIVTTIIVIMPLFYGCLGFGKKVIVTDTKYFQKKASKIADNLIPSDRKKTLTKVAVMDITNVDGTVSVLGHYISFKISEAILDNTKASLVSLGEIKGAMKEIGIKNVSDMGKKSIIRLGKSLGSDTIIMGNIVDLGVKITLNLKLIDTIKGEIISASSSEIERTKAVRGLLKQQL